MSLRRVAAAPFLRRGTEEVTRTEFVYSLSGDLGWFEPDEAEEVLRGVVGEGLVDDDGGSLSPGFDHTEESIPDGFSPSFEALGLGGGERGVFERAVERLVGVGYEKREAVAEINRRHAGMGDVRVEAAALLVAKEEGLRVSDLAEEALGELRG